MQSKFKIPLLTVLFSLSVSHFTARTEESQEVRVLSDFESSSSLDVWQGTCELSSQFASQGQQSLKVTLPRGREQALVSEKLPKDWSHFDWLAMEITSQESHPQILSLSLYDELADDEQANTWSEAFLATRKLFLDPGRNHIRVLLKGMRTSSDTRLVALDRIRRLVLSNDSTSQDLTVFLDNLRLVRGDPQQDLSSASKPEDTLVVIRNRFVEIS